MTAPSPPPAPGDRAQAPPPAGAHTDAGTGTARRRLTRRSDDRLVAGVAAGIADHLGVDPVLVRVGFVVLALWPFPGFGVLLYVALALLLPDDDAPDPRPHGHVRPTPARGVAFYVGVALLVVAVIALVGPGGGGLGGIVLPLILIGVGVALWVADRSGDEAGAAAAPTSPGDPVPPSTSPSGQAPPSTSPSGQAPPSPSPGDPAAAAAAWEPPPPAPAAAPPTWEPPPRPPSSPLGRRTVGAALTAAAALWAAHLAGAVDVRASAILAVALGVLGLGLLVGSVAGRARWLAWVALPLAVLLLTVATVEDLDLPLHAGVGDRTVTVLEPVPGDLVIERLGAGRLIVDLTGAAGATAALDGTTLDVVVGAGELEVLVPPDVRLVGEARVEVGEVSVRGAGQASDRSGLSLVEPFDLGPDDAPSIDAQLRVGAGQLTIRTVPATDGSLSAPTSPVTLPPVAAPTAVDLAVNLEVTR